MGIFKEAVMISKGRFNGVSRKLLGGFREVQESFREVSRKFHESSKEMSMNL